MNEELTKILQHEYQNWLSQVKDEKLVPLPIRILVCLIVYPIKILLQLLWILVCLPVTFILTRMCTYPIMFIRCDDWKDMINRDLTICELLFKRSWLRLVEIIVEWISRVKTVFDSYSYKSWITVVVGTSYTFTSKEMHERINTLVEDIINGYVDYGKVGLCEDDISSLMKEMLVMIIKPKFFIRDGVVHVGR